MDNWNFNLDDAPYEEPLIVLIYDGYTSEVVIGEKRYDYRWFNLLQHQEIAPEHYGTYVFAWQKLPEAPCYKDIKEYMAKNNIER